MKQITKILCPTDMSYNATQAVKYAYMLAGTLDAELILLHVLEEHNKPNATKVVDELHRLTQALTETTMPHEVRCNFVVRLGPVRKQIVECLEERNIDLMVMSLKGCFLKASSIAKDVIDMLPCPVIAIPIDYIPKPIKQIIYAAMDFNSEAYESMDFAALLAQKLEASLLFVNVALEKNKNLEYIAGYVFNEVLTSKYQNNSYPSGWKQSISGEALLYNLTKSTDLEIISSNLRPPGNNLLQTSGNCLYQLMNSTSVPLLILQK